MARAADLFDGRPLKLDADPFASSATNHASPQVQSAFREIVRQLLAQTPLVLVTGPASAGKTLLVEMTARLCLDIGLTVRRVDRGDLLHVALGERPDVLLVDEANSVDDSILENFSPEKRGETAATTIFFGLPSCVARFASTIDPVLIKFDLLSRSDAEHYLRDRAAAAGFDDLFSPEAMELVLNASNGSPRLLRRIASLAYASAVLDSAFQIGPKHVASALDMQLPPNIATQPVQQSVPVEAPVFPSAKVDERLVPEREPQRSEPAPPRIEPYAQTRAPVAKITEDRNEPRNDVWSGTAEGISVARLESASRPSETRAGMRRGMLAACVAIVLVVGAVAVIRPWMRTGPRPSNVTEAPPAQPAAIAVPSAEPAIQSPAPGDAVNNAAPEPIAPVPALPPQTETADSKRAQPAPEAAEPRINEPPPLSAEERAAVARGVRELERAQDPYSLSRRRR